MVEILRNKWCDDLDDTLQCPICFECPSKTWIYQCLEGHHVCKPCKDKLSRQSAQCPTCGQGWSTLRNRVAENLCSKLEDIKLSLIDPEGEINKLLLPDTFCAQTQTDSLLNCETSIEPVPNSNDGVAPTKNPTISHSGDYPCCIGTCKMNIGFDRLIDHITTGHFTHFIEIPMDDSDLIFQYTWAIEWMEQLQFDRAFRIPRVGTFFLKLSSNAFGDLTGFVSMIHSALVSRQYMYQLKIGCIADPKSPAYTGNMNSCRTPITVLDQKCLKVKSAEIQRTIADNRVLKCTVRISKKLDKDFQVERKRKNRKNRNNATKAAAPRKDQCIIGLLGV